MIRKPFVFTGSRPSNSARDLRHLLPARRLKPDSNTNYRTIINWGCTELWSINQYSKIWNKSNAVALAANKLLTFQALTSAGLAENIVPYTSDCEIAMDWLANSDVVVRHKLRGHSGNGIEIVEKGSDVLPSAPLYTRYCPKKYEYRVHVMFGQVIDVTRKIRDPEQEPLCWKVRSHQNGFIFARSNLKHREEIEPVAIAAITALGLDFGAVDIIVDAETKKPLLLEVNTAPGLEGQTLMAYVNGFRSNLPQT